LPRRRGRDLFDLDEGLKQLGLDSDKVIGCFEHYLKLEGHGISRADAKQRMLRKLDSSLTEDVDPLLPAGVRLNQSSWNPVRRFCQCAPR